MNKKILLSTTIAGTMFITGMAMPSVNAANDIKGVINTSYLTNRNSISITLPEDSGKRLTRADLVKLVESKYSVGVVSKIIKGENEIVEDSALVGTGAVVRLNSGKELTVVLYGDVTGDGAITIADVLAVARHNAGIEEITNLENQKAANVVVGSDAKGKIGLADALQIAKYNAGAELTEGLIEEELQTTDDILSVLQVKDVEAIATKSVAGNHNIIKAESYGNKITVYADTSNIKEESDGKRLVNLTIDTGINGVQVADEEVGAIKNGTKVSIALNAVAEDKTAVISLTNEDDENEKIEVNIEIIDVSSPEVSAVRKAENAQNVDFTNNMKAISNATVAGDAITVTANVNAMKKNAEGKKMYGLLLKSNVARENLAIGENDESEVYGAAEDEVLVWLDATKAKTDITLKHKDAIEGQKEETYTVTMNDQSSMKVTAINAAKTISPADVSTDANAKYQANQDAIKVTNQGNNIKVEAKVLDMQSFQRGAEGSLGEAKVWYGMEIDLGAGVNRNELISSDYDASNDALKTTNAAALNKIYLWLEAKEGTKTVTLTNEETGEDLVIKIEFINVSAPILKGMKKAEGNTDANYVYNMRSIAEPTNIGNTITVEANINAMKENQEGRKMYGILVDTGIERKNLSYTTKNGTAVNLDEDLSAYGAKDTEILVWLDAKTASTVVNLTNKNDAQNTALALTIKVTNSSAIKVATPTKATHTAANVNAIKSVIGEEGYEAYVNNMSKVGKLSLERGTTTYNVNVDVSSMVPFKYVENGETGLWFALLVDTGVIKEKLVDPGYGFGKMDVRYFGATKTTQALLWFNADKEENIITIRNIANPQEEYTFTIKVNNVSMNLGEAAIATLKEDVELDADADTNTALIAKYEHDTSCISKVTVDSENKIITVNADLAKMGMYEGEDEKVDTKFGILLDTGIAKANTSVTCTPAQVGTIANFNAKDTEILLWLDAKSTEGIELKLETSVNGIAQELDFKVIVVDTPIEE